MGRMKGFLTRRHRRQARMFEVGPGAKPKPTMKTLKSVDLDPIREKLREAGLTCIGREAADEPQIVETWL